MCGDDVHLFPPLFCLQFPLLDLLFCQLPVSIAFWKSPQRQQTKKCIDSHCVRMNTNRSNWVQALHASLLGNTTPILCICESIKFTRQRGNLALWNLQCFSNQRRGTTLRLEDVKEVLPHKQWCQSKWGRNALTFSNPYHWDGHINCNMIYGSKVGKAAFTNGWLVVTQSIAWPQSLWKPVGHLTEKHAESGSGVWGLVLCIANCIQSCISLEFPCFTNRSGWIINLVF